MSTDNLIDLVKDLPESILKKPLKFTLATSKLDRRYSISLSEEQHRELVELGGVDWIRSMLCFNGMPTFDELAELRPDLPSAMRQNFTRDRESLASILDINRKTLAKGSSIASSKVTYDVLLALRPTCIPLSIGVLRSIMGDIELQDYIKTASVLLTPSMAENRSYGDPIEFEIIQPYVYVGLNRFIRTTTFLWLLETYKDEEDSFLVDDDVFKPFPVSYPIDSRFTHIETPQVNFSMYPDLDQLRILEMDKLIKGSLNGNYITEFSDSVMKDRRKFCSDTVKEEEDRWYKWSVFARGGTEKKGPIPKVKNTSNIVDFMVKSLSQNAYNPMTVFDSDFQEVTRLYACLCNSNELNKVNGLFGVSGLYYIASSTYKPWALRIAGSITERNKRPPTVYLGSYKSYHDALLATIEAKLHKRHITNTTRNGIAHEWSEHLVHEQEILREFVSKKGDDIAYKIGKNIENERIDDIVVRDMKKRGDETYNYSNLARG